VGGSVAWLQHDLCLFHADCKAEVCGRCVEASEQLMGFGLGVSEQSTVIGIQQVPDHGNKGLRAGLKSAAHLSVSPHLGCVLTYVICTLTYLLTLQ